MSGSLLACEMNVIVRYFEHSLALPFFGIGIKTDLFQSCGHSWVFQICWHIEPNTFTSSFRIWNSSTGFSTPPLALFIVIFPKAYLTSHSRMSLMIWPPLRPPHFPPVATLSSCWISVSLSQFCKYVHLYDFLLGATYKGCHRIYCFFPFLSFLSMSVSGSIHVPAHRTFSSFLMGE